MLNCDLQYAIQLFRLSSFYIALVQRGVQSPSGQITRRRVSRQGSRGQVNLAAVAPEAGGSVQNEGMGIDPEEHECQWEQRT